jgi:hypothetical protein
LSHGAAVQFPTGERAWKHVHTCSNRVMLTSFDARWKIDRALNPPSANDTLTPYALRALRSYIMAECASAIPA